MSANILSPEERLELITIPTDISDIELARFFTLSPTDLSIIDPRIDTAYRLDQAARVFSGTSDQGYRRYEAVSHAPQSGRV